MLIGKLFCFQTMSKDIKSIAKTYQNNPVLSSKNSQYAKNCNTTEINESKIDY